MYNYNYILYLIDVDTGELGPLGKAIKDFESKNVEIRKKIADFGIVIDINDILQINKNIVNFVEFLKYHKDSVEINLRKRYVCYLRSRNKNYYGLIFIKSESYIISIIIINWKYSYEYGGFEQESNINEKVEIIARDIFVKKCDISNVQFEQDCGFNIIKQATPEILRSQKNTYLFYKENLEHRIFFTIHTILHFCIGDIKILRIHGGFAHGSSHYFCPFCCADYREVKALMNPNNRIIKYRTHKQSLKYCKSVDREKGKYIDSRGVKYPPALPMDGIHRGLPGMHITGGKLAKQVLQFKSVIIGQKSMESANMKEWEQTSLQIARVFEEIVFEKYFLMQDNKLKENEKINEQNKDDFISFETYYLNCLYESDCEFECESEENDDEKKNNGKKQKILNNDTNSHVERLEQLRIKLRILKKKISDIEKKMGKFEG